MLNEEVILILNNKEKDVTSKVISISGSKIIVQYDKEKVYSYNRSSLKIITNPIILNDCVVITEQKKLTNISKVLKFDNYIKVFFNNGTNKTYKQSEVTIEENLLNQIQFRNVFDYFKEMANHLTINDITQNKEKEMNNKDFLKKIYEKLNFINPNSVIGYYINGLNILDINFISKHKVYPFSFNLSQQSAVKNAFSHCISVIEGPPGTGKTQTILNIIANAIINGKTVAVLSNNNSATDNVFEKLDKNNLGSICAKLGKRDNIKKFLIDQLKVEVYPEPWSLTEEKVSEIKDKLSSMDKDIEFYLLEKNEIAKMKQELNDLKLEQKYFIDSIDINKLKNIILPNFDSKQLHKYLLYLNKQKNKKDYFSKRVQFLSQIKFKNLNLNLYENSINDILDCLELKYYETRIAELESDISNKEENINKLNLEYLFNNYTEESMKIFKHFVYKNYNNKKIYDNKSIKKTEELVKDYPVILSTTYSLLNCVDSNFMFDYMIIDESSQVDLISSFPALTLAKNVIVVGDSKQLPNIVDGKKVKKFNKIFEKYNIDEKYNYTKNSLLELTKKVKNIVEPVILREHYRCHPKIINFCNKKFYDNKLIILSKNTNDEPIKQYKSVKGNHARKNNNSQFNDRQAQIIKSEIIPEQNIDINCDSVGIITPYKEQKEYLKNIFNCDNLEIDTVHGFQGREKDIIIFSTVANEITKFLDNPNSINVAVSRAINKLYIVTPFEYKSDNNSNISNLISYINYNNFEVIESKINSIFDLLYKVNENDRMIYLKKHLPFSKYYSETIMYNTIKDILKLDKYLTYDVKDKVYPLRKVVSNKSILNEEELQFINRNSHIDFLIFNKFDKMPVLAIEVDGYYFHNSKEQKNRERKKNNILKKCNIPLLRFKTNECNEVDRITKKLDEIIKQDSII